MYFIITGGHTGMGLELTKLLLSEGHQLGLIVRSEARKKTTQSLFKKENSVSVFVADLAKRDEIERVAAEIKNRWPKIDGLFNNAGVLLDKLYYSDYGNELQLEVNAISPYLLTKALKPLLDKADRPVVVNTATAGLHNKKSMDVAAFKQPQKFTKLLGSYIDSKLTLVQLMNYLDEQWDGVRIVNVDPGAIKTKMTSGDGMPFWLRPIRNLFFKSPETGARNIYDAAFNVKSSESGIYVTGGQVKPLRFKMSTKEVDQLLS